MYLYSDDDHDDDDDSDDGDDGDNDDNSQHHHASSTTQQPSGVGKGAIAGIVIGCCTWLVRLNPLCMCSYALQCCCCYLSASSAGGVFAELGDKHDYATQWR